MILSPGMCCACISFCLFGEAGSEPKRGSVLRMEREDEGLTAILGTPALVAASIFVLHLLPREVLTFLMVWILASFPVGILIGHCVLSEQ
jgi:hypothetical protein